MSKKNRTKSINKQVKLSNNNKHIKINLNKLLFLNKFNKNIQQLKSINKRLLYKNNNLKS